jgi:surface polysaccharide O-acyltransferase-like enzyme
MIKLVWPDRLRNLATLLVVMIHVCAPIPMQGTNYDSSEWWTGNLWCSLGRPAVPLFVMLSGFLLFSKTYGLRTFLTKRFSRVVIPAMFWFVIYLLYNHFSTNNPATWIDVLKHILEGPVHYHLWFIYLIIGLYLTYPIIAPFVRQSTERELWYFFSLCLYGTWGIKVLQYFYQMKPMLYLELFTNNAVYFVGGFYLATKPCKDETGAHTRFRPWSVTQKQMRLIAIGLILFGFAWTSIGSWYHSKQQGAFLGFYYDYLSPSVTFGAVGWFLFARNAFNFGKLAEWEIAFSAASFGIYFAHPLVRDWWSLAGYWQDKYHPAKCIPIVLFLVFLTTFMVVSILRALPGGEKVS